jgi:hypothetical protein
MCENECISVYNFTSFHHFIFQEFKAGNSPSNTAQFQSADDAKLKSDLFNLIEKLRIELQKKDKVLAKEKQEKQVCKVFNSLQI